MKILSIGQVIKLHNMIIKETGGSYGIRDMGLLESAMLKAFATFDGKELYSSTIDKIAAITFSIINNHPAVDGNKRLGIMVMWALTKMNGINIIYSQQEFIALGLGIAENKIKESEISEWIHQHTI